MKIHLRIYFAVLLLALSLVAGCGKEEEQAKEAKPATQVAAKVNDHEITVHQVNNILARNRNLKPEAAEEAKLVILNRFIEQQLAEQQAIEKKLDRTPKVVQAIEFARSEILARAYLEQVAAAQPRPTEGEVKKYYAEHPELFAQRRIFSLEELIVQPKDGLAAGLRQYLAKTRSMQDIAAWLKSQDAKFTANRGVRAAEQLPLELLPKLQSMKANEIRITEEGGSIRIFHVVASKAAPVDEATATPRIQQFLFNRRSSEIVAAEVKRLKDKAKIQYFGEFAENEAGKEARAKATAEAKAKALAADKAKSEAEAQARVEEIAKARADAEARARLDAEAKAKANPSKPAQLSKEKIEKGLSGLK